LCANVQEAMGSLERGKGLIGRKALEPGEGLLIGAGPLIPIMWIHTLFMSFPLDLVFLDRAGRIVRVVADVKPWRLTAPVIGARCVLEIESGAAQSTSSTVGDQVRFEEEKEK
jgi:uncharacterized protein